MEGYTFEDMWVDLRDGYEIYYTYVGTDMFYLKRQIIAIRKN